MRSAPSLQEIIQLVETEGEDTNPLGRLHAASGLAGHLAEVGDAALGYFVDQARHAGHSWSEIGEALGVSKQAAQQKHTVRQPPGLESPAFELFTPRARNAVGDSESIARDWGHDYVGTEHLLLSLYRDPQGLAAQILADAGLPEDQATAALGKCVERGAGAPEGKLPFTPKAKAVFNAALAAASELGHGHVGTEHLLLGVDRVDGVAREVLEHAELTPGILSEQVVAKLASHQQPKADGTSSRGKEDTE
jgi:Clp amino terminal domain, pathogenicity island component